MPKALTLFLLTLLYLPCLSQQSQKQSPTFALHFTYHDFQSAAAIRATSLSTALRDNKFGKIKDMSPGLALNYIQGLSPKFDFTTTLAGSFLDYPFEDNALSGKKNLLLEGDLSIRGKMFNDRHPISPYLQIGAGISKYKSHWGAFIPLGMGIQVNPVNELYVLVNAQYRLPVTEQTVSHHFFYSLGIAGIISKKKKPAPPVTLRPATAALPTDRDNDGIVDTADACPDIAGMAKFKGCPDSDNDNIPDFEDKCPRQPGIARYQGCPIPDTDGDGINDEEDKCVQVPGVARLQGCPEPDRDRDGVIDLADKCPDLPGIPANNGCPLIKEETSTRISLAAKNILFATGSYRLLKTSDKALNEVVQLMKEDPNLRLTIEGHTDNTGTPEKNQVLSEQRAKAVNDYLVKSGIEPSRLHFAGFGPVRPIAENRTAAGRSQNRRVELLISY